MVSVAIMAHPLRVAYLQPIIKKLGFQPQIIWDTDNNRWNTGEKAWLAHDPNASHHLVLQDDVILCNDLMHGCEQIVKHIPLMPISLFLMNKKRYGLQTIADEAKNRNCSWVILSRLNWGQAIILPAPMIKPMIQWVNNVCNIPNYDLRIALYLLHKNIPTYYTMPSLVDHRTDGASLIQKNMTEPGTQSWRYARHFIGANTSALTFDVSGSTYVEKKTIDEYYKPLMKKNRETKRQ